MNWYERLLNGHCYSFDCEVVAYGLIDQLDAM